MIPGKSQCSVPLFTSLQESTKHNHAANEIATIDALGRFHAGTVYKQKKEYVDKIYVLDCQGESTFSPHAKRKG